MKKLNINKFMEDLLNVASPSGFEEGAVKIWKEYLKDLIIKEDTYGNCIALTNDENLETIMLCSHIDEVGFMVSYINDDGYIYVSTIGGVDPAIVSGQRVYIYGKNGPIPGVFGRLAIHMLNRNEEEMPEISDLYIDIGASSKEEAEKFVSIGNPVIFDIKCTKLIGNTITGKSLDDRLGAYCVAETLKNVKSKLYTVCGVASIQEENGGYGAEMATFNVKPKMAIAIDVCHGYSRCY
jgi:endoglucanase